MKLIDSYSYQCGVIDCFNEMVRAGLKKIALSHPSASIEERNDLIPFSQEICQKYGTHFYARESRPVTDRPIPCFFKSRYLPHCILEKRRGLGRISLYQIGQKTTSFAKCLHRSLPNRDRPTDLASSLSYPEEGIIQLIRENQELE